MEINSAITALGGTTGRVQLLDGTFHISSSILVDHYLTLEGTGYDTLLYLVDNSSCNMIGDRWEYSGGKSNVTIRNLRIHGNGDNQSEGSRWGDGHAILRAGHNATYESLYIENCFTGGIRHHSGDNTKILDNTIINCPWKAIALNQSFNGEILRNSVYNCGTDDVENAVIGCYLGSNHKINYNNIYGGGRKDQIILWDVPNCEINYNTLLDGMNQAIRPRGEGSECIGNTIMRCGDNALDPCYANHVRFEDNFISHVGKPTGLTLEHAGICMNGSYSTAINNTIEYCGRSGIFTGSHVGNRIENNTISNCGQDGEHPAGITIQIWDPEDLINQGTVIQNNTCYDDQGLPTQEYGLLLLPGAGYIDDLVVVDNDFSGVTDIGIKVWSSSRVRNPIFENNLGGISIMP